MSICKQGFKWIPERQTSNYQTNIIQACIVTLVISLCVVVATPCFATPNNEVKMEMQKAVKSVVKTYRQAGMIGLMNITKSCYDKSIKPRFYCVYMDMAARQVDQIMVTTYHYPPTEFYLDDQFGSRIIQVFLYNKMDMDKSNEYLRITTPVIHKMVVDKIISGK